MADKEREKQELEEYLHSKEKRDLKKYLIVAAFTVLLYWALNHMDTVGSLLGSGLSLLAPLLYGVGFAYVLNLLMKVFEEQVFAPFNRRPGAVWLRMRRPLALVCTFVTVALVLVLLFGILGPQLGASIATLVASVPDYAKSLEAFLSDTTARFPELNEMIQRIFGNWQEIFQKIVSFLSSLAPGLLVFTKQLTSGIVNLFMGLILSVYMLYNKEKNLLILRRMLCAFVPKKPAQYILHVCAVTHRAFSSFITGQLTEAVILGVLCLIAMSIFRMPYALLVSVLVGVTGVIPIFGAYLGTIPSAFIILMADPPMAFWFIVMILILQQIEGNLIYPRVVGSSIGLGGMWVILALLLGGSLFGFAGMLMGVPAFAVLYTLVRNATYKRLRQKKIDPLSPNP